MMGALILIITAWASYWIGVYRTDKFYNIDNGNDKKHKKYE